MSTLTTNYSFLKPAGTELVNEVTQLNDNLDSIDTQIKARADAITALDTRLDTAETDIVDLQTEIGAQWAILPSDITLASDAVLGAVTSFPTVAVEASTWYRLEAMLICTHPSDATPPGIQIGLTVPASTLWRGCSIMADGDQDFGHETIYVASNLASGHLGQRSTIPSSSNTSFFKLDLLVETAATPGDIVLNWAQLVSRASSIGMQSGSYMKLTELPA